MLHEFFLQRETDTAAAPPVAEVIDALRKQYGQDFECTLCSLHCRAHLGTDVVIDYKTGDILKLVKSFHDLPTPTEVLKYCIMPYPCTA